MRRKQRDAGDIALVVTDDVGQLEPVERADADTIALPSGTYPRQDVRRVVLSDGRSLYLIHADLPARAEAARIRQLEEAAFLRALFRPSRPVGPGGVPLPYWLLMFALVVGMVISGAR
ncbi:hypothetical protein [Caldinitratiruptor microaerophilus]|uniref:Uncharacterized protein n=1 Tax=Caldinitratiruptor microaerophilus TaxID=671077 RepID=A0AA35CKV0_9FIRM|nr:hypothetical protein [Caldinitratiruptor microaerophilus]BDG60278.1 hypothetical protein caldi_13680 [Caldinitratiruptor microaerophilus]